MKKATILALVALLLAALIVSANAYMTDSFSKENDTTAMRVKLTSVPATTTQAVTQPVTPTSKKITTTAKPTATTPRTTTMTTKPTTTTFNPPAATGNPPTAKTQALKLTLATSTTTAPPMPANQDE